MRVAERGVDVQLTDAARDLLGDMGYDPAYGARPLKRIISKYLVDPMALGLLKNEYASRRQRRGRRHRGQRAAVHPGPRQRARADSCLGRSSATLIVIGTRTAAFGS